MFSAPLADDPQSQARNAAFLQGLGELGWRVGRNLEINYRWGGIDAKRHTYAAELLALAPEAILAVGASVVGPLLAATRTVHDQAAVRGACEPRISRDLPAAEGP